jgi:rSAM/selenodomain-associated transferase 2
MRPAISVIIPTFNEARAIGVTLDRLSRLRMEHEVIVVDGGSSDDTVGIAQWCQAKVLTCEPGRGRQMHAGAEAASTDVLWFLHADTYPPAEAGEYILSALADNLVAGGNFRLRFGGGGFGAAVLTKIYPRLRWLGLRYGDSSLFVRRSVYQQSGGFRAYPLFEDLDLVKRLRVFGRFVTVPCVLETSSRRFEGRNFAAMFAWWTALQVLYWGGVSPLTLARWYPPVRERR